MWALSQDFRGSTHKFKVRSLPSLPMMAVKMDLDQPDQDTFAPPPTDPYLVGVARCVEEGLAQTQPGRFYMIEFNHVHGLLKKDLAIFWSCLFRCWNSPITVR